MRMLTVSKNEAGQRLDKLLTKYLNLAGKGFIYKMMRKKNITLNGKKCDGSEHLTEGDEIKLFLAEETIEKFSEVKIQKVQKKQLEIVYEDENIVLVNKPSGMLSQKAKETDESLVEYLIDYLLDSGKLKKEELVSFRPSVCNRLDRNTSGIVIAGCSLPGLQVMSEVIKDRSLGKYYLCVVRGIIKKEERIEGWLTKNEKTNQVSVRKEETPGSLPIRTAYKPLVSGNGYTLLEVELITGRSHQIRAHLASIGHPIAGDPKYGDARVNEEVKKQFGVRSQMLHAWRMVMPETIPEPLSYLAGKEFTAPMPIEMERMEEKMKAPKTADSEDIHSKPSCAWRSDVPPQKKVLAGAFGIPESMPPNRRQNFYSKSEPSHHTRSGRPHSDRMAAGVFAGSAGNKKTRTVKSTEKRTARTIHKNQK